MNGKVILLLALTACTYLALILISDLSQFVSSLITMKILLLPVLLALAFANYVLRYIKWGWYCTRLRVRVPGHTNFYIFLAGLAMSFTPIKVGELIKGYYLKQIASTSYLKSTPMVIMERVTDLVAIALLGAAGALMFGYGMIPAAVLAILVAGIFILRHRRLVQYLHRFLRFQILDNVIRSYRYLRRLLETRILLGTVGISILSWFFECLVLYYAVIAFGEHITLMQAITFFSIATLLGLISTLPGGVGATEASLFGLLTMNGIPDASATAATLIFRVATLWFAVIVGIAATLWLKRYSHTTI